MKRSLLIALPLALAAWFFAAPEAQSKRQQPLSFCPESITHEPLVIYDITGFTFIGQLVHVNLVAYSDGFVSLVGLDQAGVGTVETAFLMPNDIRALRDALRGQGAFQLCDQPLSAADTPLRTVTVFQRRADAQAHTYSYFVVQNEYAGPQQVIDTFIDTHFPGFMP